MKKFLITTAFAAASVGAFGGAAAAQEACEGEIVITEMNWASAAVVTGVATFLMEQGYGCDVKVIPSSTTPALASVPGRLGLQEHQRGHHPRSRPGR